MIMLSTFVVCEENLLVLGGPDAVAWNLFPQEGSLLERELTVVVSKSGAKIENCSGVNTLRPLCNHVHL